MAELKSRIYKPKTCVSSIIEIYIKGKSSWKSVQPDEEMLSICPNLTDSCCTKNNIKEISDLANQRIEAVKETEKMFNKIISVISNASKENLNELYLKLAKYENPSTYEDVTSFDQIQDYEPSHNMKMLFNGIEYIKNFDKSIIEDVSEAAKFVNSMSSRFGCSLCVPENIESIKNINTRKPSVVLDMSQCKQVFSDEKYLTLFAMDMHMSKIYDIFYMISSLRGGRSPRETFITAEEFDAIPSLVTKCLKETNFLKLEKCQSLCVEMKFFNGNPFKDITKSVIASYLLVDQYFSNAKEKTEAELTEEYEDLVKRIYSFGFFQPHKNQSNIYLETIPKEFSWGSGWDVMKQEFAMKDEELVKDMQLSDMNAIVKGVDDIQAFISEEIKKNIQYVEEENDKDFKQRSKSVQVYLTSVMLLLIVLFS